MEILDKHRQKALVGPGLFTGFAVIALAVICLATDRMLIFDNWHMYVVLAVYPLWGVVQHFLVQALFTRNLNYYFTGSDEWTLLSAKPSRMVAAKLACNIVAPAIVFAGVHYPSNWQMGACGLLGLQR